MIGIPHIFGGLFSPTRWQSLYIIFVGIAGMAAGWILVGTGLFQILLSVVGLWGIYFISAHLYQTLKQGYLSEVQRRRELMEANEALKSALEAKKAFLSTMSHEIRTPLNGVIGLTEVLEEDTELDREQRTMLGLIRRSGEGLLYILNDILDISRLEAEQMPMQEIEYIPEQVVRDVVNVMRIQAVERSVQLRVQVEALDTPSIGDPMRLRQVLFNLVGNAVKFTTDGVVTVTGRRVGDQLFVEVVDTGIGIPPEAMESVFEPFVQVDASHSRAHGGAGLGLAISQRLTRLMGGEIQVDSCVGAGCRFYFSVRAPRPRESVTGATC